MKRITVCLVAVTLFSGVAKAKNEFKEATPSNVELRVQESDIKVVRRAAAILSKQAAWNKKDNRQCPDRAKSFSLYCALYKASIEINGEFDHRLVALEEVRRTVEEISKEKMYEHRLMDFNNDPATSFEDIKRVLNTTPQWNASTSGSEKNRARCLLSAIMSTATYEHIRESNFSIGFA